MESDGTEIEAVDPARDLFPSLSETSTGVKISSTKSYLDAPGQSLETLSIMSTRATRSRGQHVRPCEPRPDVGRVHMSR